MPSVSPACHPARQVLPSTTSSVWSCLAVRPPLRSIYNFSNKLREQSFGWDDYRISPRKTVCVHKRLVKDDLECMSGSRRSLIIFQPLRQMRIRRLDLGNKPRMSVARHEKVHIGNYQNGHLSRFRDLESGDISYFSIDTSTLKHICILHSAGSWRPFAGPLGWRWHLDEVSEAIEVDLSPQYLQT